MRLALEGARKVLTKCIDLTTGDVLALFWEETTSETAEILLQAARELNLEVRPRWVPLQHQAEFSTKVGLSADDLQALNDARGIITCLSNQVAGTSYRKELLRVGTNGGKRFGHMPGANLSVLAHAVDIDYSEATSRCDDLALALTLGLQTYIPANGNSPEVAMDLTFELGGVDRSPITSTGIIARGTWGNLPGGETFIAPWEDTAEGVFVLNGAFKNYVIQPPTYLLLHFEKGRMVRVEGTQPEADAFNAILDFARSHNDPYYNSLAELGIGVNRGIKKLTGNALFDEKCYGTAHIAIGDSSRYGGRHSSIIHEDLISLHPSLWIDDEPILSRGKDAFNPRKWREELDHVVGDSQALTPDTLVGRTDVSAGPGAFGKLCVRRGVSAGRICNYTIGQSSTSRDLAQIYSHIPAIPQKIKFGDLVRECQQNRGFSQQATEAAIRVLLRHAVVDVRFSNNGDLNHD
jgi:leucyl aminopeptidase (aminopeptidase T)